MPLHAPSMAIPFLADAAWTREIYGNVDFASKVVFYCLAFVSLATCGYGIFQRTRLWRLGRRGFIQWQWRKILKQGLTLALSQRTVRGRGAASLAHFLLFSGFVGLTIGTMLIAVEHYAHDFVGGEPGQPLFHKGWYFAIFEVLMDTFGVALILGACWFFARRLRAKSSMGHRATDWFVLGAILFLGFSGYWIEGLRILREDTPAPGFSYLGLLCANGFKTLGVSESNVNGLHFALWWTHSLVALGLVAAFPYTRLMHVIAGSLSLATREPRLGRLYPIVIEEVEETGQVGAGRVQDFSDRQLLELDACVSCGRCQDACPAFEAGKPLSPRDVVQSVKGQLNRVGPLLLRARNTNQDQDQATSTAPQLHGDTILAETLWSCTTCNACAQVCPLGVSPVDLITEMRRHSIAEGALRGPPAAALQKTQRQGNPWGLPQQDRFLWAEGLNVPTVKSRPDFEVLYWIGCAASYDRRIQKVARSVVELLTHAQVHFAVLGPEERCTGEAARRLGDEFLFQELAESNIETLQRHKVRTIITHCPHCLNSFRQDYPQFGGDYETIHHSEFLNRLVQEGRLPKPQTSESSSSDSVTYHDPCYLARTQQLTDPPRQLIQLSLPPNQLAEPPRNRQNTSCCGAGGGRMWFDDSPDQRIGKQRVNELLETGAQTVAVGCPFCLTMVSDGVAEKNPEVKVLDIAELLADALRENASI